jgi:hypothetical protein
MGCAPKVKAEEVRFAADSPVEGDGFEPSVPRNRAEAFSRLSPFDVSVTRYRESGSFIQGPKAADRPL